MIEKLKTASQNSNAMRENNSLGIKRINELENKFEDNTKYCRPNKSSGLKCCY